MLKEPFHVAVPTGFFEDESLNTEATIEHIRNLYKQGVKSVLVSGTTGEQHSLTLGEKLHLLDRLVAEDELLDNMEVLFGVSSIRQLEAEELAKSIGQTKVSGILLGYPPYVLPSQEEALAYTTKIIDLSGKPTILYNNPARTGFDLSFHSVIQLSKRNLVIGLKEAGSKERVPMLKNEVDRRDFYFYAGGEVGLEEKAAKDFNRLSSIAGNVSPVEIKQYSHKVFTGQTITTQERTNIEKIIKQIYQGSPLVNLKKCINQKGISIGSCRSPIGNS
ncbi:dihydrodipicolinate synthase family protein [Sediminibacillus massiliensis]|uniref:dihydrodipicolinate synthase family protein n=1 Tax=Sediminibacillus massiliensis TaxID=1926277 RepID=UPI0009882EC3|nr:dihydrodipicolinate synthase family protein [Sediminibacillus massiliensis]